MNDNDEFGRNGGRSNGLANSLQCFIWVSIRQSFSCLKTVETVKFAGDGKAIVAKMREIPTEDLLFLKGVVRVDERKPHGAYLCEVKTPTTMNRLSTL